MKWSITQLRKFKGQPFEFNQTVQFDHLIEQLNLIDLSDIQIEGQLTVKSNEVVADMTVRGVYTMACARTLEPVEVPFTESTTEVFDLEGEYENEEDEHYHLATDGMINLRDIAEELVILEKPMRVFSENSDKMLREGNGWEVIDEDQLEDKSEDEQVEEKVDPRLQKLQQLYDKKQ
ncbi:YceD family protein [Staphylococcus massiliensis]|uniref:YlbN-like protein n=1 Tax=Staphylococcus massiliensis S46 TaxID=1229783 RepID=K9AJB3_9STAP|nr:YceD family protein [Staphylococcus massiliensis]EKU46191.1 hypothetical protein C273_09779 [Staphylococcus massiliensis S46]MCG3401455.1 YceD family protein [Staphylococcus massiliensis]MCG3411761.1 YceD family protein [Staphylococcus massiliensis]PNZ99520.1 DNA-binding protein [Staphylococcus massiliensis CCUG 55927]